MLGGSRGVPSRTPSRSVWCAVCLRQRCGNNRSPGHQWLSRLPEGRHRSGSPHLGKWPAFSDKVVTIPPCEFGTFPSHDTIVLFATGRPGRRRYGCRSSNADRGLADLAVDIAAQQNAGPSKCFSRCDNLSLPNPGTIPLVPWRAEAAALLFHQLPVDLKRMIGIEHPARVYLRGIR